MADVTQVAQVEEHVSHAPLFKKKPAPHEVTVSNTQLVPLIEVPVGQTV